MSRRKTIIQNEKWESKKSSGAKFTKICDDMQESDAWKKLTLRQHGLYLFLKRKYTKKSDGTDNASDLHITDKDKRIIGLSDNTLYKDIDALIDYGFIKLIKHGKVVHKPNIYGFSDMWREYGTDKFFIHPSYKRDTKKNAYKG